MTEKERMLSGKLYSANDSELKANAKKSRMLTRLFNNTTEEQKEYRVELLKNLFEKTGENLYVEPPFRCDYGSNISVGNNFYANFNLVLVDDIEIFIGNNVMIAPNVTITVTGHPVHPTLRKNGEQFSFPVKIEDDVWIGSNVVILPGVTIGRNSVIGAGSVVTKDIPENVVAVGNPCKVLREITDRDKEYYYKDFRV